MYSDFKVEVSYNAPNKMWSIWIVRDVTLENFQVMYFHGTDKMEVKQFNWADNPPPTLQLPKHFMQELVAAAARAGIEPASESALKSKLDATAYHLEDMRKLVFDREKK